MINYKLWTMISCSPLFLRSNWRWYNWWKWTCTLPRIHYEYLAHRLHQFSYDFICPTVMYPYSALAVFNHSIVLYTAVLHRSSKTLNNFSSILLNAYPVSHTLFMSLGNNTNLTWIKHNHLNCERKHKYNSNVFQSHSTWYSIKQQWRTFICMGVLCFFCNVRSLKIHLTKLQHPFRGVFVQTLETDRCLQRAALYL